MLVVPCPIRILDVTRCSLRFVVVYFDCTCARTYASLRTCNNQEDLETTSNSPRVKVDMRLLLRRAMQASQMIPPTMTCMHEVLRMENAGQRLHELDLFLFVIIFYYSLVFFCNVRW